MGSSPPTIAIGKADAVERAIRRIQLRGALGSEDIRRENAADLVVYLFENGICDEDELVELAMLADGKRYDPVSGHFD
ncbi:hypothetical protein [Rhizobium sp. RU36D]|uniref:hypothetical protein n=1 Tax=Rhizobium sp. RU36D TaxID=1907415 RepID=UPI0009D8CFBC|nr:hypothetical protein [Rhizobium sp. RU36D]SMC77546.1 hypothetical protein SAMN05880593_106188 [Rhizobium sp. RU36D]